MSILEEIKTSLIGQYEVLADLYSDGCIVSYPGNKDILVQSRTHSYSIRRYSTDIDSDKYGLSILKLNEHGEKVRDIIVNMPPYTMRSYIICDIVKSCVLLGYPYSLVKYQHQQEEVKQDAVFDVIGLPTEIAGAETIQKEQNIREIFLSGNYNKKEQDEYKTEGIEEGFNLLWNIFWEIYNE